LHEWAFPGAEGGDFDAAVRRLRGVNRQIYDEMMSHIFSVVHVLNIFWLLLSCVSLYFVLVELSHPLQFTF
jgi:hypothetical protein